MDKCDHMNSSIGRIENPDIGQWMKNELSELTIGPYDVENRPAVNLFSDRDCSGM